MIDKTQHRKGILLISCSLLAFGLMQIFVAKTGPEIPIVEQVFFRNLIGMMVAGFFVQRKKISLKVIRSHVRPLLARSIAGYICVFLLFYASRNAAQSDVTIIVRTEVFSISAVSSIFLREKIGRVRAMAMLIAMIGALIAANPAFDSSGLPLLAALGVVLCDTVSYPLLSFFTGRVHAMIVVLFFSTFSTLFSLLLMIPSFVVPDIGNLFCLLMIGSTAAIGQITLTYSHQYVPAGELSVYQQLAIVCNTILALLFLHEIPTLRTCAGGVIVLTASLLLFRYRERRASAAC